MSCPRCRGLMVPDRFADFFHDGGYISFTGWRCLCCGNILDPVILRNQQAFSRFPLNVRDGAAASENGCGSMPIIVSSSGGGLSH